LYYAGGGIRQTFSTAPGVAYNVSFYAGTTASHGKEGTGIVRVSINGTEHDFPLSTASIDWDWSQKSFEFTASGGSSIIEFYSLDSGGLHIASIDNISINQVPEPSTKVLGFVGLSFLSIAFLPRSSFDNTLKRSLL
jgi:hypothetical protein